MANQDSMDIIKANQERKEWESKPKRPVSVALKNMIDAAEELRAIQARNLGEKRDRYCNSTYYLEIEEAKAILAELELKTPNPSPEARVDWEKEANKLIDDELYHVTIDGSKRRLHLTERIAKALSAAFEKGREAR